MGGGYSTPEIASQHFGAYVDTLPGMSGKVVVITGTTSGTGFVAARTLAQRGAKVLMLNRPSPRASSALERVNKAALESGAGGIAEHIDCDLQSFDSVRAAADQLLSSQEMFGIDVLVNNAGELYAKSIWSQRTVSQFHLMGCVPVQAGYQP
jgi:NAD(P)-dependent dehydrogenase (short-subunit alcohol dehydrogenase family)